MTNEVDVESIRIESIEFTNYKALRKATLPLSAFTLLLGPNGSGKSSALHVLRSIANFHNRYSDKFLSDARIIWESHRSITIKEVDDNIEFVINLVHGVRRAKSRYVFKLGGLVENRVEDEHGGQYAHEVEILNWLRRMQSYSLDSSAIAMPITVRSEPLSASGSGLAAVLDDIKDNHPENWELLIAELMQWLPEYDHIMFDKPHEGHKRIALRTLQRQARIPAQELSQGTLIALAMLTLAYMPNPPSVVGLEEIDRGLHPRLLRHLRDALYRLSYPQSAGIDRPPIQVIATTHSPYMLDLFRDHPEEVVLAEKKGLEVEFKRLSEMDHYSEILGDSPLSEVWYSGVLGGVTVKP